MRFRGLLHDLYFDEVGRPSHTALFRRLSSNSVRLFRDRNYVEGTSWLDFFALNDARTALGIQKRSVNNIPTPIDPRMV